MTQTPLSPLDESHRWTRADWLAETDARQWLDAGFRVVDCLEARADSDNDRFKALCSLPDLAMAVVVKAALALLAIIVKDAESVAYLRDEAVLNGATRPDMELATVHRLEVLAIAECQLSGNTDLARELAVGSDTPPHAHLVAAVILLERMSRGPGQRQTIAGLRDYFTTFGRRHGLIDDE